MPRYYVTASVRGSKYLGEYEAANEKEACRMAWERDGYVSLCHQCSSECEDPEVDDVVATEIKEEGSDAD